MDASSASYSLAWMALNAVHFARVPLAGFFRWLQRPGSTERSRQGAGAGAAGRKKVSAVRSYSLMFSSLLFINIKVAVPPISLDDCGRYCLGCRIENLDARLDHLPIFRAVKANGVGIKLCKCFRVENG
jgi:hypothetical protein